MNKFFILHGHFYQPPREDPWWLAIPRQDSAHPFHNWNERIYWECYLPNATARVFDNDGKIIDTVNNYSYINFDFGPTLLLWLRVKHPEFINFLKASDEESENKNHGHGNSIAQAYSHMILPLANEYDKDTQIFWGKRFFESIFERESEGMWLPETACNIETLKFLVKYNVRYIILSPYQAERIRKIGEKNWKEVADGSIEVGRPYRIFLDEKKEKYIDCFFYHGSLSHAVSFQRLIHSAGSCADRIIASYSPNANSLVSVATDGETFGHYHPFSEMCLAYLIKYELPKRGVLCTNFGAFLSNFSPEYEVQIKRGRDNLGTSWSCSHGVRRWYDDCGCKIGFYPHWHQRWRKPLRDALDWLRGELDIIFLRYGSPIFKDIWQARNAFIEIIIDPSETNIKKFYHEEAKADDSKIVTSLKLLEMEHMGMLFYTSCAWFFDDISGLEAVQNLKYAARAIQLAKEISGDDLEEAFLNKLSFARSNVARFGDGRGVYELLVKPYIGDWNYYLSSYLIYTTFFEREKKFYRFEIEAKEEHKIVKGEDEVDIGRINISDKLLMESKEAIYLLKRAEIESLGCYLSEFEQEKFNRLKALFEGEVWISDKNKLAEVISEFFFFGPYLIKDIHHEEQEKIVDLLFARREESIFTALHSIWETNLGLLEEYRRLNLLLPYEIQLLAASILNRQIKDAFHNFKHDKDFKWIEKIKDFMKDAKKMRLDLDLAEIKEIVREIAQRLIEAISNQPDSQDLAVLIRFHREMLNLNIDYYTYVVQNIIADMIQTARLTPELQELARVYGFNCDKFLEVKKFSKT